MLGRMFAAHGEPDVPPRSPNDRGDYVIQHQAGFSDKCFTAILDFYRVGKIRCPPNVAMAELHAACKFFLIPFSHESVKSDDIGLLLHQLSNQGAQTQFRRFTEDLLIPAMARSAELGERECHVVLLCSDDVVEWDDDMPPRLGEQYAQVVRSTALVRFMKYHENRALARAALRQRGLRHVKIGIEGFPTFAEKIRRGEDGTKSEVIYNYEQRPFLKLSWEQEDSKSRHVNFQTVRARTSNG